MTSAQSDASAHGKALSGKKASSRQLVFFLPALVFVALAVALGWGLTRNARELPSNLLGKPVPEFSLPPVQGRTLGLSSDDLKGEVSLVNVWASWCAPCRREKPLFLRLKEAGVMTIRGLNYKDDPARAAEFLNTYGNAYTRTGADIDGRVGIEWGVYGLPETFVFDESGLIRHRNVGELTPQALEGTVLPLVRKLQEE